MTLPQRMLALIVGALTLVTTLATRHALMSTLYLPPLLANTEPPIPAAPTRAPPLQTQSPDANDIPAGIFALVSQVFDSSAHAYDDTDDYIPHRSDVHDEFSWKLMRQVLLARRNGNAMLSPFSVKLVLAVLAEAAANGTQTQRQLLNTLGDVRLPANLRSFYKKTLSALTQENPNYTLHLATRLYADTSIEPHPAYTDLLHNYYETGVERLDFGHPQAAAARINGWGSNATRGQLPQVVSEASVWHSVMVLVNVIHFEGLWRREFQNTFDGVFFRTPDEQTRVAYMQQTDFFYYFHCNVTGAQMLRLPYRGKKFSMFVVLPNERGVDALLHTVQNGQLKRMQWLMERVEIKVTLPKFRFDHSANLKEALQHLGITEIFGARAALPGIDGRPDAHTNKLMVSNIFQKSGIDVTERGTEAYAATVVEIVNKFGGSEELLEFHVNRPFAFVIEEEATGNILFAGKVNDPVH